MNIIKLNVIILLSLLSFIIIYYIIIIYTDIFIVAEKIDVYFW